MNFYIKKIRLWFNNHPKPQDYEFHPNKVNVVTGDSSTGKSSILRIIDYCLMAQESTIVDDVINNNVSWYGLSFRQNKEKRFRERDVVLQPEDGGTARRAFPENHRR